MNGARPGSGAGPTAGGGGTEPGVIRVLRGNPGAEELAAAVTALLATLAAAGERSAVEPVARWSAPARRMTRTPGSRATGAWRAAAWP